MKPYRKRQTNQQGKRSPKRTLAYEASGVSPDDYRAAYLTQIAVALEMAEVSYQGPRDPSIADMAQCVVHAWTTRVATLREELK